MKESVSARSVPFTHTRDQQSRETAEDYVEAIAEIVGESGTCRVLDLARHFDVSHVTVSRIVRRLATEQLLTTAPYRPIELTPKGMRLAKQVRRRHQTVFDFLISIGVDARTAAIDSEGIEHHVSPKTLQAMRRFLKRQ